MSNSILFYKRTGLEDYLTFIGQNGLKGTFQLWENLNAKNDFLHLPLSWNKDQVCKETWKFKSIETL